MTTRWEKGDSHAVLIVEGETTNCTTFKKALEIDFNGNILIDCMTFSSIDPKSIEYLEGFAKSHKSKRHSIILASPLKNLKTKKLEVVPTVSEARELIFMEIAERELGFYDEDL